MWRDFHHGVRQILRRRVFAVTVILLVALGIGSNTLVFSLANELLLKSLLVRDPENLYLLERNSEFQVRPDTFFAYAAYRDIVQHHRALMAAVAEQEWLADDLAPLDSGGRVRLVMAQMVSPNYFSELGIRAATGRVLNQNDASGDGAPPVVLSYQFWQSQYGGRPDIIGSSIRLRSHAFAVAGVAPREFHSSDIDRAPDVRLPVSGSRILGKDDLQPNFRILVRLAPGVSPQHAAAALLPEIRRFDEWAIRERNARLRDPAPPEQLQKQLDRSLNYRLALEPIGRGASRLRDQFSTALWLLLGGVGLLLLAVCANVAGLLMARADERRREIAIRAAVGAGRWQLIRQLLCESVLLALPGAALGLGAAFAAAPLVVGLLPPARDYSHVLTAQLLTVSPDLRVLGFTAALTGFSVLTFGLLPAWRASRPSLAPEWKTAARGPHGFAAAAPVALQTAFCLLLLAASGLMYRTFRNLNRLDPGFDRAHIVEFTFDPGHAGYTPDQSRSFHRELRRRVESVPGVRSTAYAAFGVMRGSGMKTTVAPLGGVLPRGTFLNTSVNSVTPGYFTTMGMALLSGRDLDPGDADRKPKPIVVNQALANAFFPRQDPVGKVFVQGIDGNQTPAYVIAGVTTTAKYRSLREPDPPTLYGVLDEGSGNWPLVLHVRTYGTPAGIIGAVRDTAAALDAGVPLLETVTLDQEVRRSLWQERLVAILSAFFGIAAALLAALGLYGMLTVWVARRRHELGIRVAIGARAGNIVRTVSRPVALAVACGMVLGVAAVTLLLPAASPLLFGLNPFDPPTIAAAAGIVLVCAAAAAARPAWRAVRTDPVTALREE